MTSYTEEYSKNMWWKSCVLLAISSFIPYILAYGGRAVCSAFGSHALRQWEKLFENATYATIMEIGADIAIIILSIFFFGTQVYRSLYKPHNADKITRLIQFGYLCLFVIILFISNSFISGIIALFFANMNAELNTEVTTLANPVISFLCSVIFAPIAEEVVFRFGVFRLINLWNRWAAHFLCAILFGLFHVLSFILFHHAWNQLIVMLPYCISGFCLTMLYEKTGNFCFPIALHMINNGLSVMLTWIFK